MNNYFDDNPRGRSRGSNDYFRENRRPSQGYGRGNARGGGRGRSRGGKAPLPMLIIIDVLAAALILLIFYVTNYEAGGDVETEQLSPSQSIVSVPPSVSPTETEPSPSVSDTETVSPTPTLDMTIWRNKFADKFTSGEVEQTETSYKSNNVSVSIEKVEENGVVYFFADIYITDIKYFKATFGKNKAGSYEFVDDNLKNNNGVIGINGDNCWDNPGLVIRNGVFYKRWNDSKFDALVMYNDGTMKIIPGKDLDFNAVKAEAPYQVWGFGPMLLDSNGQPMTKFNTSLSGLNPRTAIGYYEPGHYCFVVVDGRRPNTYSKGFTMTELSQLMYDRGCKVAFNLDGGDSSQMAFLGKYINDPSGNRQVNDMIYITDSEE